MKPWLINPLVFCMFQARGVRKVTTEITDLWQPSIHSDVAFWSFNVSSSYHCKAEFAKHQVVHPGRQSCVMHSVELFESSYLIDIDTLCPYLFGLVRVESPIKKECNLVQKPLYTTWDEWACNWQSGLAVYDPLRVSLCSRIFSKCIDPSKVWIIWTRKDWRVEHIFDCMINWHVYRPKHIRAH